MITTIILISFLLIAIFYVYRNPVIVSNARGGKDLKIKPAIVALVIFITGCIIAAIQPFEMSRVKMGNIGLKVNLTGDKRGLSDYKYATGWTPYNTWTEELYQFETTIQHIEYPPLEVTTKGGFTATITPTFNYSIVATQVGDLFQNHNKPLKQIEQEWLKTSVLGSMVDAINKWAIDSIFNNRELLDVEIIKDCNKRVGKWFNMSQVRTNIKPPPALQQAIEAKTKAMQDVQVAENQKLVAVAKAQKQIAEARGDSAYAVIQAAGEAESIRRKQMTLSPIYVEYMKIEKWDGKNPNTVLGEGMHTMVNIK